MQAAERLARRGKRVGLVANDQATNLVDTELLKETGAEVEEVAGGCFCCRFPEMIAAMERLVAETGAEVLIGEPVGSCTDLSATVLQPLKELYRDRFELAPFTVLVDGNQVRVLDRLRRSARQSPPAGFPDDVLYIYEKQLEEADLIVLNKIDRLSPVELAELKASLVARFPDTPVLTMSALIGNGVNEWLELLAADRAAGRKLAEVDYDIYAAGEAALGWLNASVKLHADTPVDWQAFVRELIEAVRAELRLRSAEMAHVKISLTGGNGQVAGNLTGNDAAVFLHGTVGTACHDAHLLLNARVAARPEELQSVVEGRLQAVAGRHRIELTIAGLKSFMPGRPQPTHRYESIT